MNNSLFIMTHLGSGWEKLSVLLEQCPRIEVFQTGFSYKHPDDVSNLTSQIHRRKSSAAIWADVIFHNKDFVMKRLCNYYKFIFWSSSFEDCVDELISKHGYNKNNAENYWRFRIEGMKQYHKRTQNSLWNPSLEKEFILASILG
jgi:hypothetical protein